MTENDFVPKTLSSDVSDGLVTWKAPSNIALVKYWGKLPDQIPANASVSFTLQVSATTTTLTYRKLEKESKDFSFDIFLDDKPKPDFAPKIQTFLSRIEKYLPFLKTYHLEIRTTNSFPHSSGIASSASGMAALALCLMEIEKAKNPEITKLYFDRKASFLARLGSGSACRSIDGELVQWGKHKGLNSGTDLYGIPYPHKTHPVFTDYQDTILLVHQGQKQVSSTVGHALMEGHIYADQRFRQAAHNLERLKQIFEEGDLKSFIEVVESEALTLHAMMMTSIPYFVLMKPNTLRIIEHIWEFRKRTGLHPCFTLDAGANVHLLYPNEERKEILAFIKDELLDFCEEGKYIEDQIGQGATKLA
ncbi:diphosphomevalonate/mevalonate 3,5-bisphosphate decarboxylase family protein [Muriicola sp. Z0-33]|uniref:diphosphomevalonate/mevalonate 3,5-bisphosphate decarboxylase family protein n=1 Tax=Muriicola sp. Z0-33 TaxID=2816957 RepID=UPI0022372070|nr:diphosphomevalonate decarboxylase [Muriicola sp. Z0-33]MCW5515088.1 diphosphomevalonate decarboxylase [Muriicola sp. Z0-33]